MSHIYLEDNRWKYFTYTDRLHRAGHHQISYFGNLFLDKYSGQYCFDTSFHLFLHF